MSSDEYVFVTGYHCRLAQQSTSLLVRLHIRMKASPTREALRIYDGEAGGEIRLPKSKPAGYMDTSSYSETPSPISSP